MKRSKSSAFVHPLGLSKIEWSVMQGALQSQTRFGIKDFLPSLGKPTQNAIARLVERGFLTLSAAKMSPPQSGFTVVRITKANIKAYNAALKIAVADTKA